MKTPSRFLLETYGSLLGLASRSKSKKCSRPPSPLEGGNVSDCSLPCVPVERPVIADLSVMSCLIESLPSISPAIRMSEGCSRTVLCVGLQPRRWDQSFRG